MKTKPLIKQPTYEEIEAKIRFAGSWMHTICAVANDTAHTLSLDAIDELKAAVRLAGSWRDDLRDVRCKMKM